MAEAVKRRPGYRLGPKLPAGPLLEIAQARAIACFNDLDGHNLAGLMARELGVTERTVLRWMNGARIHPTTADQCATRLGLHIDIIWPWGEA